MSFRAVLAQHKQDTKESLSFIWHTSNHIQYYENINEEHGGTIIQEFH